MLQVATLYYYQGLTTEAIAGQMEYSRPKVSRLLNLARQHGLVEIRVVNPQNALRPLEALLSERFGLKETHIVPVPQLLGEDVWQEWVTRFAAHHLNATLQPGNTLAVAWGTTIGAIASHLVPKRIPGITIVQLNGSGNTFTPDNQYAAQILQRFAENYQANYLLFPVPSFFDYKETKETLWRERSIQRIIDLQRRADVFLYSVGAVNAGVPSHVYSSGYLEPVDLLQLETERVVGDLATVFFREDGHWDDIALNLRASGPPLDLYKTIPRSLCVVSGRAKVPGLHAALRSGYINELVIDEPTATLLCRAMGVNPAEL